MASAVQQADLFGRQEMANVVPLADRKVLDALADEKWDFRTIDGIARETGVSAEKVSQVLNARASLVRRSLVRDRCGRELYTLRDRKAKRPERMAFVRMLLTKTR